jgi:hypothetical protein
MVTAAEIKLLQYIHGKSEHGKEPVVDVVRTGRVNRSDHNERIRLATRYSELADNGVLDQGPAVIQKLFGVEGVPLPQVYEPPVFAPIEDMQLEEVAPEDETVETVEPEPVAAPPIRRSKPKPFELTA